MSTNNQLSSTSSQPLYPKKSEKIVGNKRKYRRYNWIFLLSVFFPVVTVGVFNIFVDPYDVFNTPNFLGINHLKPRKDNTDRLKKAIDIIRIKPVTVLIGSSITKQGLDPNHPAFNNEQPVYNLGLNSANIYELRPYIEHVFANQKELDLIILGLDFFMFDTLLKNRANFSENRLEKRHISSTDLLNISLSLNAFLPSTETVAYSKKIPPDSIGYGENGFTPYRNPDPEKTLELFRRNLGAYYKMYTKYKLPIELTELKKIVDFCAQKKIKLILFISPSHAIYWEIIQIAGKSSTWEKWKRKVVEISDVFDFSGYNSITSEPINNKTKNYKDSYHYINHVGNLILNRILSYKEEEVPEDLGILINP